MIIRAGDRVRIKSQGITVEGEVVSAGNYPEYEVQEVQTGLENGEPVFETKSVVVGMTYYLEVKNDATGLVHYWKSDQEPGTVEVLEE